MSRIQQVGASLNSSVTSRKKRESVPAGKISHLTFISLCRLQRVRAMLTKISQVEKLTSICIQRRRHPTLRNINLIELLQYEQETALP